MSARYICAVGAATLLAAAFLVPASWAAAGDQETLSTCIASEESAHACIGRIAKPCMDEPGSETTAGMIQCNARETEAWDGLLNTEYKRLMGALDGEAADKLRAAQRAWVAMRDGDCALSYHTFAGGTIAGVVAGSCMLDRTATRVLQLRDLHETNNFE